MGIKVPAHKRPAPKRPAPKRPRLKLTIRTYAMT